MTGAISPKEIAKAKAESFPSFVFDSFNALITAKFVSEWKSINIKQDEVINLMIANAAKEGVEITRREIFDLGYLNIEAVYHDKGWAVSYNKPAYNEDYPATFTFEVDTDD